MQPGHAARFCFKALCRALRAGEAFGSEQRLPVNRESLQIEAGEALPHFFHFRCHPFHLFTFFTVYLFEGHFYLENFRSVIICVGTKIASIWACPC